MQKMTDGMMDVFERIWKLQGREGTFAEFIAQNAQLSELEKVTRNVAAQNARVGNMNESDGYDCKKCLNKGEIWWVYNHDGRIEERFHQCECIKVRRALRRLERSGLKNSLKKFADFNATEDWQLNMLNTARAYVAADHSKGESLFLGGAVGSGKTFIGTAVCRELLHKGHEVIYMPWVNEAQRLKALANDDSLSQEVALYSRAEYLYIDDLFKPLPGQTAPTPADVRLAYDIINYRYINKLPTIISCEKYMTELMEIDEATISRLYEKAKGYTVNIGRKPGRNYRMIGADAIV